MTCDPGLSVTAAVVEAATGRITQHRFPLPGGEVDGEGSRVSVVTEGSFDCYTTLTVPPEGRRWMFDGTFSRVAATTVVGLDEVQYVISIDTGGRPVQYAVLTRDQEGWADPPLFDADSRVQWRLNTRRTAENGHYGPGSTAVWAAPAAGGEAQRIDVAPQSGPDRVRPYFLDRDGRTRVWRQDASADDVVPGNLDVDGWAGPGGLLRASWSEAQDTARFLVRDGAGRASDEVFLPCTPTAWLDARRLLCTGSVVSDSPTGVHLVEVTPGPTGPQVGVRSFGVDDRDGWHRSDAVPSPDGRAVAVLSRPTSTLHPGVPPYPTELLLLDAITGATVDRIALPEGRWRGLGWR